MSDSTVGHPSSVVVHSGHGLCDGEVRIVFADLVIFDEEAKVRGGDACEVNGTNVRIPPALCVTVIVVIFNELSGVALLPDVVNLIEGHLFVALI